MKVAFLAAAAATLFTAGAAAQQAPQSVTFSTYYRCDLAKEGRADTLYKQVIAPALDRQVKAGHLTGYGFSSHVIGGGWRRLAYLQAASLEHLMAGRTAYQDDLDKTNPKGSAEFDAICGAHDDYIWANTTGSKDNPSAAPAPVSYSRYLVCDQSKEAMADLIVEKEYAPIMEKHLAAGHISSWAWLTHSMGGSIRRVLLWRTKDLLSALNAEEMIGDDMSKSAMSSAFMAACSSHTDYIWQVETASR